MVRGEVNVIRAFDLCWLPGRSPARRPSSPPPCPAPLDLSDLRPPGQAPPRHPPTRRPSHLALPRVRLAGPLSQRRVARASCALLPRTGQAVAGSISRLHRGYAREARGERVPRAQSQRTLAAGRVTGPGDLGCRGRRRGPGARRSGGTARPSSKDEPAIGPQPPPRERPLSLKWPPIDAPPPSA